MFMMGRQYEHSHEHEHDRGQYEHGKYEQYGHVQRPNALLHEPHDVPAAPKFTLSP